VLNRIFPILVLLLSTQAFAAEGTSEATSKSMMDDVYVNFFSIFHGPEVTGLDTPYTPNTQNGKPSKAVNNVMNFDSEITAAYLITPTIGIGPVVPFFLYPVMGQGFTLGDVGIKAFNKKFISNHDLNVYANLILQLPTSDYSKAPFRDMSFAVKMTPNVRYTIPDSRFTLGAWTEQKAYLGVKSGKTFKLYAAPYVNYQVTPKFSWNLEFEAEADHMYGKPTYDLTMFQNDLMPGFVYFVTPKIMINPYLQIFTKEKVAIDRTAVGAVLSASI
jgi:hypothetical protein